MRMRQTTVISATCQPGDLRPQGFRGGLGAGTADNFPHVLFGFRRLGAIGTGLGVGLQPAHLVFFHLLVEELEKVVTYFFAGAFGNVGAQFTGNIIYVLHTFSVAYPRSAAY